jgi:hypothetical protein
VVQKLLARFFAIRAAASRGVALTEAPSARKAAGVVRRIPAVASSSSIS